MKLKGRRFKQRQASCLGTGLNIWGQCPHTLLSADIYGQIACAIVLEIWSSLENRHLHTELVLWLKKQLGRLSNYVVSIGYCRCYFRTVNDLIHDATLAEARVSTIFWEQFLINWFLYFILFLLIHFTHHLLPTLIVTHIHNPCLLSCPFFSGLVGAHLGIPTTLEIHVSLRLCASCPAESR